MIKPMLATLIKEPFDDEKWIFEIKWDGYRALAHKTKKIELLSRNNKSFNTGFPLIVQELGKIPGAFILDGEIVILEKGRSSFQLLQNSQEKRTASYQVFDILHYNGEDLTQFPLIQRKKFLRKLLQKRKFKYVHLTEYIETAGKRLFKKAKKRGWEGIIAKKKDESLPIHT